MPRPDAFLSHASPDRKLIERLAPVLEVAGVKYFYSKRHITGAQQWHDELGAALERCNWFILLLTPNAVRSVWVKRELLYALQASRYRDRIAPLLFADCKVSKLSWTLPAFQYIDFRNRFQEGCESLLQLLEVKMPARQRALRAALRRTRRHVS